MNLQNQIRQKFVDGIINGAFAPGMKLPSSRKLAAQLNVVEWSTASDDCSRFMYVRRNHAVKVFGRRRKALARLGIHV